MLSQLPKPQRDSRRIWNCGNLSSSLRDDTIFQTWQSAKILGRVGCSCRSECRTMGVCADFEPEQWQDDMEPDRHTHRAAGSALQTGEAASQSNYAAKTHLLVFLFPLPTAFMCFGTSGTHNSEVNSQTSSVTVSTTLWRETGRCRTRGVWDSTFWYLQNVNFLQ